MRARAVRIFDFALEQTAYFEIMFLSSRTQQGLINPERLGATHAPTFRIDREAMRQCRDAGFILAEESFSTARETLAYCIEFCAFQFKGALPMGVGGAREVYLRGFDRMLPTSSTSYGGNECRLSRS